MQKRPEKLVVMIAGDHTFKTFFLERGDLIWPVLEIFRPLTLIGRHQLAVHIDRKAYIAKPSNVLSDIHIKKLQTLVIVDHKDKWPWAISGGRSNQVPDVLGAAKTKTYLISLEVGRGGPLINRHV